jgi:hypothetical protein
MVLLLTSTPLKQEVQRLERFQNYAMTILMPRSKGLRPVNSRIVALTTGDNRWSGGRLTGLRIKQGASRISEN